MAVRATMSDLITRLRLMVNDPAGASQTFSDREIQDALDGRRQKVKYAELTPRETIAEGGAVSYLEFYASVGDWESDETLVDAKFAALIPSSADRLTGEWAFASTPAMPVLLTGKTYDLNGAAADVLDMWAAKAKLQFDFTDAGSTFRRSQQSAAIADLARYYRRRARPRTATLES